MSDVTGLFAGGDLFAVADVSDKTQRVAESFLYRQAEILDEKQWENWLALFAEDGFY